MVATQAYVRASFQYVPIKPRGNMRDNDLIFFRPMWRRVAVTLFCVAWAAVEWLTGQPFWGIIASGVTAYCVWVLFYNYKDPEAENTSDS